MSKVAYLWIVEWPAFCSPKVTADLFFSSKETFLDLYLGSDKHEQQLVEVVVPDTFDDWDYIPDNY